MASRTALPCGSSTASLGLTITFTRTATRYLEFSLATRGSRGASDAAVRRRALAPARNQTKFVDATGRLENSRGVADALHRLELDLARYQSRPPRSAADLLCLDSLRHRDCRSCAGFDRPGAIASANARGLDCPGR